MRIQSQRESFAYRIAGPVFDWRRSPEYDSEISKDHHSAPLENGDRLHVYRLPVSATNPWVHEIEPHDMPSRLPLSWHSGMSKLYPQEDVSPNMNDFLRRYPNSPVAMAISRNPEIDPPGTDRTRRNFSGWGRMVSQEGSFAPAGEPVNREGAPGEKWENGKFFPDPESAMAAVEQRYREEAPKWKREDHSSGVDYSDLNRFKDFL